MQRFASSANFKIVGMPGSTDEIDRYLDNGEAWMAHQHPRQLRPVGGERPQPPRCRLSPTAPTRTRPTVAMGYAQTLIAGYSQDLAADGQAGSAGGRRW